MSLARTLQAQIRAETNLSCSFGIGRNKLFAKLASDAAKPGGIIEVWPEDEAGWLARLPVSELPGAGPKMCEELAHYNVHTVAQLAALSESILVRLFGANGRTLWQRTQGVDERPVRGNPVIGDPPNSISRETTLEQPTADDTFLSGMLSYLVQRATWDLRRRRLEARTLGVKLRYGDFQTVTTSRALATASSEDRVFVELAYELFARLYTRRLPVRHVGVEFVQLKAADDAQRQLFDEADKRRQRQLRRAVDQVRDRFGFQSMVEGSTTHLIDRLDQDRRGFRLRTPSLSR